MSDVTRLLHRVQQGEAQAAEELLLLVYHDLRRIAAYRMAQEPPGQTLQATALVHEAWLRVAGSDANALAGDLEHYLFSPHGQLLEVAMGDNTVQLWRTDSGQRLGPPMKTTARVTWMQFSAAEHLLITAESGEREPGASPRVHAILRLWDTTTALPCGRPIPATVLFMFTGAHLSPDSRYLVVRTFKTTPATSDRPVPVLQVWPLPVADLSLAGIQQRTESRTGLRLDAAGNVVAAGTASLGGVSGTNTPQRGECPHHETRVRQHHAGAAPLRLNLVHHPAAGAAGRSQWRHAQDHSDGLAGRADRRGPI